MIKASKLAGVDMFVQRHPMGYDMQIGERGLGLSGGQKQSIGVARATLADCPLMFMDEPSNAMDQLTEQNLMKNLKPIMKEKTLLLVTQKMNLLSLVERVIVMKDGKLFLDGDKDAVVKSLQGNSSGK
jgi:ATP-binding cassette subfamily C protein LapB